MTSSTTAPSLPFWLSPFEWVGRSIFSALAYLGGVAFLLFSALLSPLSVWRDDDLPGFWFTFRQELSWMLMMGLPLVGLVHVGMGSFLSLQAYFGSTFVDGTGAVVGVGLLRNLATLMTGLTMSALLACRMVAGSGADPGISANVTEPGRIAAPRLAAAAVATTLLSFWGFLVGTVVGWQCADTMMGLSSETFFLMFYRMIWFRDVVGVIVKGMFFGLLPAAICCYEGFVGRDRPAISPGPEAGPGGLGIAHPAAGFSWSILRGTCLSMVSILVMNMTWFLLVYHAVPIYGPSLLSPPTP
jgi:phospholipid/cholesterol/gamma-HCH transport system permease protein